MSNIFLKIFTFGTILFVTTLSLEAKEISAYYSASYQSIDEVKNKLEKEGFEVVATYAPAKKEYLHVLLFTNPELKALASQKKRGFAAIERLIVNSKEKTVQVSNPNYWLRAFMQTSFKQAKATKLKVSLTNALGSLVSTKDVLAEKNIAGYHYAISMPYYQDMVELKGEKDLLNKIKNKKKVFELKLSDTSTLVGIKMSKGTEKFIESTGEKNALALPYTILIEDDKAYALQPKYYLAISNPLLSLSQFMKISSIPDAIIRKLKKAFK